MKIGSVIPIGGWTQRSGKSAGWYLQIPCWLMILSFAQLLQWWSFLAAGVMWFVSGWLATLLERKLYGTQHNLDLVVMAVDEYGKDMDDEFRLQLLQEFAPEWWVRLMSPSWRIKLQQTLNEKFGRNPT